MPRVPAVRTYLRMLSPAELKPRRVVDPAVVVEHVLHCSVEAYRRLYRDVGDAWHWHDRDSWSDDRLASHLARDGVSVHVLRVADEVAGYFELERRESGDVELLYFGLIERFFGRGLGAHLLTVAVEDAWRSGATWVWVNTCTLDHPSALANYRARGFTPFREENYEAILIDPVASDTERHGS
jgi:GNAT superfamily N-acetyltransferase